MLEMNFPLRSLFSERLLWWSVGCKDCSPKHVGSVTMTTAGLAAIREFLVALSLEGRNDLEKTFKPI